MRKTIGVLAVLGVTLAACTSRDAKMSEDLQKDLALASSSEGISLAPSAAPARSGISAIERSAPTPRRPAPSQRVRQRRPVRHSTEVAPVEVASAPDEEAAPEPQPSVEPEPESDAPASTRPRPVEGGTVATGGDMGGGSVGRGGGNRGIAIQVGIGVLGAILRGGVVEGDRCDPRGSRRGPVAGGPVIGGPNGPIMRGPTYYAVTESRRLAPPLRATRP